MLRVKGIVAVSDHLEQPLVIHGVQHVFHPPVKLETWPSADRRTRVVFITRDLPVTEPGTYPANLGNAEPEPTANQTRDIGDAVHPGSSLESEFKLQTHQFDRQSNWFIVLWAPPAFRAASPAKYPL